MFISGEFSMNYHENRDKSWKVIARYAGKIVGVVDVSIDRERYKNICVRRHTVRALPEVGREDIFKHFIYAFCERESLPVYFKKDNLRDIDIKYLLDLGAEELVDSDHETMWYQEDPTVLRLCVK